MTEQADNASIPIGAFARLAGLSVTRLRRYHELGILVPSNVDPRTGYRSYSPEQLALARRIAVLRRADLPLEEVVRVTTVADTALSVLERHRDRLAARAREIHAMTELVDELIRKERHPMATPTLQLMEVILRVEDVEETVAFYRDVFEMDFAPDDHEGTLPVHYDACGGSWDPEGFFMFTIYPAGGDATRTTLGFGVPDVDAVWERAQASGAVAVASPSDSGYMPRHAIFEDNAGNRLHVYQRAGEW